MKLDSVLKKHLTSININLNAFQQELLLKTRFPLDNMLVVAGTGIGKTLGASLL